MDSQSAVQNRNVAGIVSPAVMVVKGVGLGLQRALEQSTDAEELAGQTLLNSKFWSLNETEN